MLADNARDKQTLDSMKELRRTMTDSFEKKLKLNEDGLKTRMNVKEKVNWKLDDEAAKRRKVHRNLGEWLSSFYIKTQDDLMDLESKIMKCLS
jgi:hypothetical protein